MVGMVEFWVWGFRVLGKLVKRVVDISLGFNVEGGIFVRGF